MCFPRATRRPALSRHGGRRSTMPRFQAARASVFERRSRLLWLTNRSGHPQGEDRTARTSRRQYRRRLRVARGVDHRSAEARCRLSTGARQRSVGQVLDRYGLPTRAASSFTSGASAPPRTSNAPARRRGRSKYTPLMARSARRRLQSDSFLGCYQNCALGRSWNRGALDFHRIRS